MLNFQRGGQIGAIIHVKACRLVIRIAIADWRKIQNDAAAQGAAVYNVVKCVRARRSGKGGSKDSSRSDRSVNHFHHFNSLLRLRWKICILDPI